jgi:hypothetical protein
MNTIAFKASEVLYNEAIDGGIVQVSFDEDPDQNSVNETKCYLMLSRNYEFPGSPTVEWHDGKEYDGGSEVLEYKLTSEVFELITNDGLKFSIQHDCQEKIYVQIEKFLRREFGNSKLN